MKKIMFNDKYGLNQAVLDGRKTNTRRFISTNLFNAVDWKAFEEGNYDCIIDPKNPHETDIRDYAQYKIGEEVAIAQNYNDVIHIVDDNKRAIIDKIPCNNKGWRNAMFTKAGLMPHRIKITDIRVERLQDIGDEDCMKEGIREHKGMTPEKYSKKWSYFTCNGLGVRREKYFEDKVFFTGREAFAALIDKVSGKGTWNRNQYVFVYEFELIK